LLFYSAFSLLPRFSRRALFKTYELKSSEPCSTVGDAFKVPAHIPGCDWRRSQNYKDLEPAVRVIASGVVTVVWHVTN